MSFIKDKTNLRDVKKRLKDLGLSTTGKKNELVERLKIANNSDRSGDQSWDGEEEIRSPISESELLKKECELLRKEKELLEKELELERKQKEAKSVEPSAIPVSEYKISFIRELISNFNGYEDNFENWKIQLETVKETYKISEELFKIILVGKLKCRALTWFRSKADHMKMTSAEILDNLENLFGQPVSRITRRREFEARSWKYNEDFLDYFHAKVELGNKLDLDEKEIIEYIIEGINDINIRNQARMKRFKTIKELMQVMSTIGIGHKTREPKREKEKTKVLTPIKDDKYTTKCFNCGKRGHWASECLNKKREWGSCYKCGKKGHKATTCVHNSYDEARNQPGPSRTINQLEPSYTVWVRFVSCSPPIRTPAIINSGAAVSLVRESFAELFPISPYKKFPGLVGLRKTPIEIIGAVEQQRIEVEGQELQQDFVVVADDTMDDTILLGRDFINNPTIQVRFVNGRVLVGKSTDDIFDLHFSTAKNRREFGSFENFAEFEEFEDFSKKLDIEDLIKHNSISKVENVLDIKETDVNLELGINVRNKIYMLFENYLRALYFNNVLNHSDINMKINLKKDETFSYKPRRISYYEKEKLQVIIRELLDRKIIRSSDSPYSSSIVLVKKKTGDLRMCVDYRHLNNLTIKEHFPIPIIEDYLQLLYKKKYFTSLDLKSAFYNVPLHEDSIKYTSFVTPFGQYEFLRMPFGLANAPSVFQRYFARIFSKLLEQNRVLIYFDDIFFGTFLLITYQSL